MVFRPISCLHVSSVENGNLICFKRESHLISRYDQRRFDHPIKCFLGIRCVLDHPIKCFFGIRCVLHIFVPEHFRTAHFRTTMPLILCSFPMQCIVAAFQTGSIGVCTCHYIPEMLAIDSPKWTVWNLTDFCGYETPWVRNCNCVESAATLTGVRASDTPKKSAGHADFASRASAGFLNFDKTAVNFPFQK